MHFSSLVVVGGFPFYLMESKECTDNTCNINLGFSTFSHSLPSQHNLLCSFFTTFPAFYMKVSSFNSPSFETI